MFKKVELWLVTLFVVLGLLGTVVFGWAVFHQLTGGQRLGRLGELAVTIARTPAYLSQITQNRNPFQVREDRFGDETGFSFSYAPGTRPDLPFLLVNRHDPDIGVGVSELVDLNNQKVVFQQQWDVDPIYRKLDFESAIGDIADERSTDRYAPAHAMLAGGRIVAKYQTPLFQVNSCGILTVLNSENLYHHSLEADGDGSFWTAAHLEPKTIDLGSEAFLDDGIVRLASDGRIRFQKSVAQILIDNGLGYLLYGQNDFAINDDPIHLNDVEPALATTGYWQKGDVFLSLRHLSMVAMYRPSTNKLLWYRLGLGVHQHDVNVVSDHEISIFDNNTTNRNGQRTVDGSNRFLIYDFATDTVRTLFDDALRESDVRSPTGGRATLLDNGTLFVEETDFGRAMAIRENGDIDWQFINRGKDGKLYYLVWSRIVSRAEAEAFLAERATAKCD